MLLLLLIKYNKYSLTDIRFLEVGVKRVIDTDTSLSLYYVVLN